MHENLQVQDELDQTTMQFADYFELVLYPFFLYFTMVIKSDVFERIGLEYVKNVPPQVANIKHFWGFWIPDPSQISNISEHSSEQVHLLVNVCGHF